MKFTLVDVLERERDKMTARLFYDPGKPSAFSFLAKLQAAIKQAKGKISTRETQDWLECQDAYSLHKPVRKHFPRNPYSH
jgi:hypothetical protein